MHRVMISNNTFIFARDMCFVSITIKNFLMDKHNKKQHNRRLNNDSNESFYFNSKNDTGFIDSS